MRTINRMTYLSYLAYADFFNTDHREVEKSVCNIVKKYSQGLNIKKELPWGPVAIESKFLNFFSNALIYMVEDENDEHKEYTIVVRGTNPVSLSTWKNQNFDVDEQVDWSSVSPCFSSKILHPKISKATKTAIRIHTKLKDHNMNIFQMVESILIEYCNEKVIINITGHSLGGLMSSTIAQIMYDEFQTKYPKSEFKIYSFAGPTAGNSDFVKHTQESFHERLSCKACKLDIATHVWNYNDMKNDMPNIYEPEISMNSAIALVLKYLLHRVEGNEYFHLFSEYNVKSEVMISPFFDDYLSQAVFQHVVPYIAEAIADDSFHMIIDDIVTIVETLLFTTNDGFDVEATICANRNMLV